MGLFGSFGRALSRREKLVEVPAAAESIEVARLHVHLAEDLVVLTTTPSAIVALLAALDSEASLELTCQGERPVYFTRSNDERQHPTLDPKRGWILPITQEVAGEIVHRVRPAEGSWELTSINIGIVVENE